MGMYVPTKREVATLPPLDLYQIVIDWIWDSPSELIPNDAQIAELRTILSERQDADDQTIMSLIGECDACTHK